MFLKKSVKYQLGDFKKPLFIYYLVIYVVYISLVISMIVSQKGLGMELQFEDGLNVLRYKNSGEALTGSTNGIEIATIIFLFVCGLNSFREYFLMHLQNGLSRKTLFQGYIISLLPICVGMAVVDSINGWIAGKFIAYNGLYSILYHERIQNGYGIQNFIESILFYALCYGLALMVGYSITVLYYRLSTKLKVLVSVGVPALLVVFLPIVDEMIAGGEISLAINNLALSMFGLSQGSNPYVAFAFLLMGSSLCGLFSYRLLRRVAAKE